MWKHLPLRPEQQTPHHPMLRMALSPRGLRDHSDQKVLPWLNYVMHACRKNRQALGHVWTAPGCQGFLARLQRWSVQPCVRPLSAARESAGHNAFRGSGPGQKRALESAMAQMGCPDHGFDPFCIPCCRPSPTVPSCPCRSDHAQLIAEPYFASAAGSRYPSPDAIIAQAIRASLLASAMVATLVGRRSRSFASQGRFFIPCVLA